MFTFKHQSCERKKHLSDGRQLEEISKEVYSGGAASAGIQCLAEESNLAQGGVTGKAESLRTHQCTSTERVYCVPTCWFKSCASFFLMRGKAVCGK